MHMNIKNELKEHFKFAKVSWYFLFKTSIKQKMLP